MTKKPVVVIDPEIMSGEPCFAGTRVPVRTLLDHLEAGDSMDIFLNDFPTVSREQAIAFLEQSAEAMLGKHRLQRTIGGAGSGGFWLHTAGGFDFRLRLRT